MKLLAIVRGAVVALLATMSLAACSGGGGAASAPPCSPPAGTQTVLVYPKPGATGIPDDVGVIIFGSTRALPSSYGAYVVNNTTNNAFYFNQVSNSPPNPLPTPNATPSFPNPVYRPAAILVSRSFQEARLRCI